MKALTRWPWHPEPGDGEALSSWLTRVAGANRLSLTELLGNLSDPHFRVLGREFSGLDRDPPQEFLDEVAGHTGRTSEQLHAMTIAGLVPTVLDTLTPSDDPDVFSGYVHRHQVLLTPRSIRSRATPGWRAWLPPTLLLRACPICVAASAPVPRFTLLSQLPLTLSCPDHGCYLESVDGAYGSRVLWTDSRHDPRDAPPAVKAMDRRTHDALRTGVVALPRREVTAAVWFRLLRTILDELATFPTHAGRHKATLNTIWERIGEPPRAGQMTWCTYEALRRPRHEKFLEAAAAAIDMIEPGTIKPAGADGQLFLPPPPPPTPRLSTTGGQWRRGFSEMSSEELWQEVRKSFVKAISLARKDPAAADELFRFLTWGPGGADKAHTILADLKITVPNPSHNTDSDPSRVIE